MNRSTRPAYRHELLYFPPFVLTGRLETHQQAFVLLLGHRRYLVHAPRPLAEFAGISMPSGVSGALRVVDPAIRWSLLPGHLAEPSSAHASRQRPHATRAPTAPPIKNSTKKTSSQGPTCELRLPCMPIVIASRSARFLHRNDRPSEWERTGSGDSQQPQGSVESLRLQLRGSSGSPESLHPRDSVESLQPPAEVEHPAEYILAAELDRQVKTNAWLLLSWFP
jgi:hypothetical protein